MLVQWDPRELGLAEIGITEVYTYRLPLTVRFRGIDVREGMIIKGPYGYGDFCPFPEYGLPATRKWWESALEAACSPPLSTKRLRTQIPVNAIIPVVPPETAYDLVAKSHSTTIKVKVADKTSTVAQDEARLEAVRAALGPQGNIRIDVNGIFNVDKAVEVLPLFNRAAGGLEYIEQPVWNLADFAEVARHVDVPLMADESVRLHPDPFSLRNLGAAAGCILKVSPLGGIANVLRLADQLNCPVVLSSALESSIGLRSSVIAGMLLPELGGACGLDTARLFALDVTDPLLPTQGSIALTLNDISLHGVKVARQDQTMQQPRILNQFRELQQQK